MPFSPDNKAIDQKFPNQTPFVLDNFKRGVITLIDQSKLPKNALREADNIYLTEDGAPTIRPGIDWFGNAVQANARAATFTDTVNLITNPSLETNATGWSGVNGGTLTRDTTEFYVGAASLKVVSVGAGVRGAVHQTTGLTASNTYTWSFYTKAASGVPVDAQIDTFNSIGTYVGSFYLNSIATGSWQRGSITVNLGATEVTGNLYLSTNGNNTFYADAVMLQPGNLVNDYFDGSTTATLASDHSWTGVAHASTSLKRTYDLTVPEIEGLDYFDFGGVIHLVAAIDGKFYRSTDNAATWTLCTGATYTKGKTVSMNQYNNGLYLTTGVDPIAIYDGTTTLFLYTTLATPAAPTIVKSGDAAMTPTTYTYYYKISRVNKIGFSPASAKGTIQTGLPREQWDTTLKFVTLTLPAAIASQERYDIYFSEDDVNYYYIDSIVSSTTTLNTSYKDGGAALVIPSTVAPTGNTTTGPSVAELTNIGTRMYGVRDPNNRYRIWFTSGAPPLGAFSSAYDGGYLDWQPGGKFIPVKAEDYRDKSGSPIATIWCDSADGEGCILQMGLDTLTVGTISITVPAAYKLAGSRGTNAPGSVVNVLNDYMYYNSQAFYNLGNRVNLNNIISTDESSPNIRPTVRTINAVSSKGITSVYSDAKVFFSVPYGLAAKNSHTIVYDTEQKAWLPTAFTVGFSKFLKYTDTTGVRRLLAVKPGDNRVSEIATRLLGDYGVAFRTSLLTGLYQTTKNRFEFQTTPRAYIEFSNPQGDVSVEILGIDRKKGYTTIKSVNLNVGGSVTNVGWDTFSDDSKPWDDTSVAPQTYSESSVKRYFNVQKELNAIQWRITTNSSNARYVLRTLQTEGTDTQAGPPKEWRIKT